MRPIRRGGRAAGAPDGGGVGTLEAPSDAHPGSSGGSRRRYDPAWDDWNPPRRWPGVLLTCVIVLGFLAVVAWHYKPSEPITHHTPKLPSKGSIRLPFVVGGGTKDVIRTFYGTHDASNLKWTSNGELLILHAKCKCAYNFDVTIEQGFDQPVSFPISATSHYESSMNITLPAGDYDFAVVATGPWKIQLIAPRANLPTLVTPFKYFSAGDSVIGPFTSSDTGLELTYLSKTHDDIFTHIVNLQGVSVSVPLYGKSPYQSAVVMHGLPDVYYLAVDAVGFWDVKVLPAATS
jgi:hypothetical protein